MSNNICFECGEPAEFDHHVVPRVLGGTKTVPLCNKHHGLVHGLDMTYHGELTKVGLAKARAAGKVFGSHDPRCRNLKPEHIARGQAIAAEKMRTMASDQYAELIPSLIAMRDLGLSFKTIANSLNADGTPCRAGGRWSSCQVWRVIRKYS